MTWTDVDLKNGIIALKVGATKNEEARTVYLDQELKALVQKQREKRKQDARMQEKYLENQTGTNSETITDLY